jgi:glycosyltransferase involved in cell wall biosynthesis
LTTRRSPDVSIVIPTQNRRGLLRLTLTSALRQRDVEFEVIVVDDGSTDGTSRDVTGLADPRARLVRRERRVGMGAARNAGIAEARGSWIAFLDDDDLWAPDKLHRQLEEATTAGRGWVYAGDVNVDSNLRVVSGAPPPTPEQVMANLPRYNSVPTGSSNVVVHADLLGEAGRFDPSLRRIADWDMWIRLARVGPPACVSLPLVAYRFHPLNIAVETASMIREPEVLAKRYGIPVDRAAMQRWAAWSWLRAGRRGRAVWHYAKAISMGDLRSVARAFMALVHPAVGSDRVFGLLRNPPEGERWRREAQAWLDDLARATITGSPR